MKRNHFSLFLRAAAFTAIFAVLLTAATLLFLPKWPHTRESAQTAGFYQEPDNTLDVLFLGSCNMYSSMSPVLLYKTHGITGYCFCCPDQEMSTSYYYLKEALKTQDLKAVVLEPLFLTLTNTKKREYYNRFAFDYIPPSLNKIRLAWETSRRESVHMKQYDSTASDPLLTFASYMFPLLRYHSRTDLTRNDLTFFLRQDLRNPYKGGIPQYTYTTNDGNYYNKVFNGDTINEMSLRYVPMMKALCDEKGIPFIIAKSPNYARWGYDDVHTKIVRDYAASLDIPFIDFMAEENNNFEIYDYGYQTGRLNVYGVRKFSKTMGDILVRDYGLTPTVLSEKDKIHWQACVDYYDEMANAADCSLYPGQIAQLSNLDGAISVRWNPSDSETYSVYRAVGKDGGFALLSDSASGMIYEDTDVLPGQGYTYYVVPNSGALAGVRSDAKYYVYVDMPQNFTAENVSGKVRLSWDDAGTTSHYRIERRVGGDFNFSYYDSTTKNTYTNMSVTEGYAYYYRLCASCEEDGVTYRSMTTNVRIIPQTTPMITGVSTGTESVTIKWNRLKNQRSIQVWRRSENEAEFTLLDTISGGKTSYTDQAVEPGVEYFYRLVSCVNMYNIVGYSDPSNTVGAKIVK